MAYVPDMLTADYAGQLIEDNGLLSRFIENNRDDRTMLQKLLDAVKELVGKLTGRRREQARDAQTLLERAVQDAAQKNAAQEGGGARYSLNADFGAQFDRWMESQTATERKNSHFRFFVGTTSEALQSIGVSDYKIYWGAGKVAKIMEKHPAMTAEVVKSVPEVLEHPILVMQSQTVANRITLFGEAVDADGKPVLVALELSPQNKSGEIRDFAVIASAYGKKNAQNTIDNSEILYVDPDKKRTNQWLLVLGLQLPSSVTTYGSIASITTVTRDVNGNISFGETGGKTAMQEAYDRALAQKTPPRGAAG